MTQEQELRLIELLKEDVLYQQLLTQCRLVETAYRELLRQLPKEKGECIEHYISLCEEMEYRRTCIAIEKLHR